MHLDDLVLAEFREATRLLHAAELAVTAAKERYTKALQAMHAQALKEQP